MTDMIKLKYKGIPIRNKRSISRSYYVEALVVADTGMVDFHQDGQIETYILTLMNMVSDVLVKFHFTNNRLRNCKEVPQYAFRVKFTEYKYQHT